MAKTQLLSSLEIQAQIPLDIKLVVATLDELIYQSRPSVYYEDMVVRCLSDHKSYIWREELYINEPNGLLTSSYTYPTGSETTDPEIDYSDRIFNFFLDGSFDEDFAARLRALVYVQSAVSFTTDKDTLEKGLVTNVVFNFTVTENDDTLVSAVLGGVVQTSNPDSETYSLSVTTQKTLIVTVLRTLDLSQTAQTIVTNYYRTVGFYAPQFYGKLASGTLEPASFTVASLTSISDAKYIQSNDSKTVTATYANQYAFFITNSNSTVFKDGNDFTLSIGAWASTTDFIIKKTITITLANGTTDTMYLYRTRETVNATTTFKLS
tara:strand:- start:46 stop:1011 length:966 start_codon:yes stop_codon:yes gene_type:complete